MEGSHVEKSAVWCEATAEIVQKKYPVKTVARFPY